MAKYTTQQIKQYIEDIITKTFSRLKNVYDNNREKPKTKPSTPTVPLKLPKQGGSRLIFPRYSLNRKNDPNGIRISEQEVKQIFIEEFNLYCDTNNIDLFYSVETPTQDEYSFSGNGKESANFDLVIFDEDGKRKVLIEFKALNADAKSHSKDFEKLGNNKEDGELFYFIEVLKSHNQETINNLKGKINEKNRTIFKCYSLELGQDISNNF